MVAPAMSSELHERGNHVVVAQGWLAVGAYHRSRECAGSAGKLGVSVATGRGSGAGSKRLAGPSGGASGRGEAPGQEDSGVPQGDRGPGGHPAQAGGQGGFATTEN